MKVGLKHVKVIFTLTNMTIAKGHSSKTKSQMSVLRTRMIGRLVMFSYGNPSGRFMTVLFDLFAFYGPMFR